MVAPSLALVVGPLPILVLSILFIVAARLIDLHHVRTIARTSHREAAVLPLGARGGEASPAGVANPSIVVTLRPAAACTGVTQALVGLPSKCTVQAPHCAIPQPNLVPVNLSSSRNTHRSGVSGALALLAGIPFSTNSVMSQLLTLRLGSA